MPGGKRFFQTLSYTRCSQKGGKEKQIPAVLHCRGRKSSTGVSACSRWLLPAACPVWFRSGRFGRGLLLRPPEHGPPGGTLPSPLGQPLVSEPSSRCSGVKEQSGGSNISVSPCSHNLMILLRDSFKYSFLHTCQTNCTNSGAS